MPRWFTEDTERAIMIRLMIVKVILYTVVSFGISWQICTKNIVYSSLSVEDKIGLWVGMIVLWGDKMMAFVDTTASKVVKGKFPFEDADKSGDTIQITKQQTQQTTIQTQNETKQTPPPIPSV